MLTRIVRLVFQEDKIEEFQANFAQVRNKIKAMPGCHDVNLYQDAQEKHVFYTISLWDNETALDNYRHSELFKSTWKVTKAMFAGKPVAYSLIGKNPEFV